MSAPALLPPEVEASIASNLEPAFYIAATSLVIWVWDTLLNLDVEISVVWSRKGTIVKTFYAVVRRSSLEVSDNLYITKRFVISHCLSSCPTFGVSIPFKSLPSNLDA